MELQEFPLRRDSDETERNQASTEHNNEIVVEPIYNAIYENF